MDWHEQYKDKITTAAEAVSHVRSGEKIIFADWIGEPPALVEALVNRYEELENVTIIHGMSPGPNKYLEEKYTGHFHHISLFIGPNSRPAYLAGRVDYIGGTNFHNWPDMFAKNPDLNPHWAFIQVTPPDENGMCSFGNTCCFTEPAARTADRIIVQVNPDMPFTGGKLFDLSKADYIVEERSPLYVIGRAEPSEKIKKIADYCASLIEDGATL